MAVSAATSQKPTYLYRIYDHDGRLLYVGITFDLNTRMNQHRKHKQKGQWYREADLVRTELYPNRETAAIAEHRAIAAEKPVHNWATEDKYKDDTSLTPEPLRRQDFGAGRWRV